MKISQLAKASGESIPTIKFYIRQGLLPAGRQTARNQASYDGAHLERLELIRALKEGLGMSIERIADIFSSADAGGEALLRSGLDAGQIAQHGELVEQDDPAELNAAQQSLSAMCGQLGWSFQPGDPATRDAASAIATILRFMPESDPAGFLAGYATAMMHVAEREIPEDFDPQGDPMGAMTRAVLGTYLFEPVILALRRMAHTQRYRELVARRGAR